jgi:hypothetical protein
LFNLKDNMERKNFINDYDATFIEPIWREDSTYRDGYDLNVPFHNL